MSTKIRLGISPCPNDTYIFHALVHGLVDFPMDIELIMADVEELNARALKGELDVTKLSLGVMPKAQQHYALINSGAALGFGCGPLIVSNNVVHEEELATSNIAIPGAMTTANLLLNLHGGFRGKRIEMIFDAIIPSIVNNQPPLGVIIHEGRFTYAQHGLHLVLDLGQWWEEKYALPLPLGAIAVHRRMPKDIALCVEKAIASSIQYAHAHPQESKSYIQEHAQELAEEVIAAHIATFVNDFSINLGKKGRFAIQSLLEKAHQQEHAKAPTNTTEQLFWQYNDEYCL